MACPDGIDPRIPRFGQALTGAVLLTAAFLQQPALVLFASLVLAGAALGGPRWSLWARLFGLTLAHVLDPPAELEDPGGPRFAKQLGFAFTAVASLLLFTGSGALVVTGWVLALTVSALALFAAATGFCVACQFYGLYARFSRARLAQG